MMNILGVILYLWAGDSFAYDAHGFTSGRDRKYFKLNNLLCVKRFVCRSHNDEFSVTPYLVPNPHFSTHACICLSTVYFIIP